MRSRLGSAVLLALVVGQAGCSSLPSVSEQTAQLGQEPFSPTYRLAVASAQWRPDVATFAGSGLANLILESAQQTLVDRKMGGAAPIDVFDRTLRELVARKLPADAQVLERSAYGGNAELKGTDVTLADVAPLARTQDFDGLLFVYLEPRFLSFIGGAYSIAFRTHAVLRSLRRDTLLVSQQESIDCPGGNKLEKSQLAATLAECYASVTRRVSESLERRLDLRP